MEIITFEKVCENTPLNPNVLQRDQFEKCKKVVFETHLVTLIGVDCISKLKDDVVSLLDIWVKLKADFSENGGGLLLSLSWLIYLEWLNKFGEAQITTKGLKLRTDDFTSVSEAKTYNRMVADAEGTAIKFLEKTKEFLYSNNSVYNCIKELNDCVCGNSGLPKTSGYFPNFTIS